MCTPKIGGGRIDRQIRHGRHAISMSNLYQVAHRGKRHSTAKRIKVFFSGSQQLIVAILPVVKLKSIDVEARQFFQNSFRVQAGGAEVGQKTIAREIRPGSKNIEGSRRL